MNLLYLVIISVILIFAYNRYTGQYTGIDRPGIDRSMVGGTLPLYNVLPPLTNWRQHSIIMQEDPYHPLSIDRNPRDQLLQTMTEFGAPTQIDPNRRGYAVWTYSTLKARGLCFDRIFIDDRSTNFMTVWLHYPYPFNYNLSRKRLVINDLSGLDPHIDYDEAKKMLIITANRLADIKAYLVASMRLIDGNETILSAQQLIPVLLDQVNPRSTYFDPLMENRYFGEICEKKNFKINQFINK